MPASPSAASIDTKRCCYPRPPCCGETNTVATSDTCFINTGTSDAEVGDAGKDSGDTPITGCTDDAAGGGAGNAFGGAPATAGDWSFCCGMDGRTGREARGVSQAVRWSVAATADASSQGTAALPYYRQRNRHAPP